MIEAVVTGNVGRVGELKTSGGGKAYATFSVASSEKKDGPTTWVDVVCFDEQAEQVAHTLQKGQRVVVTGRLSSESYEKQDGTMGVSVRLVASDVGLSLRWPRRGRVVGAEDGEAEPLGVGEGQEEPDTAIPF